MLQGAWREGGRRGGRPCAGDGETAVPPHKRPQPAKPRAHGPGLHWPASPQPGCPQAVHGTTFPSSQPPAPQPPASPPHLGIIQHNMSVLEQPRAVEHQALVFTALAAHIGAIQGVEAEEVRLHLKGGGKGGGYSKRGAGGEEKRAQHAAVAITRCVSGKAVVHICGTAPPPLTCCRVRPRCLFGSRPSAATLASTAWMPASIMPLKGEGEAGGEASPREVEQREEYSLPREVGTSRY